MNGIDDKAIADHLQSTLELADQMIMSAGQDANGAFLKAIGALAQVIFITVVDEQHKKAIGVATDQLRTYLNLLTEVSGMGTSLH
jgi:Holliday junction resolvasome RuvABC DNA-binding subunit